MSGEKVGPETASPCACMNEMLRMRPAHPPLCRSATGVKALSDIIEVVIARHETKDKPSAKRSDPTETSAISETGLVKSTR